MTADLAALESRIEALEKHLPTILKLQEESMELTQAMKAQTDADRAAQLDLRARTDRMLKVWEGRSEAGSN